ncbi:MAG: DUF1553 domain-containing protein [Verrucomicrobiales bacterium]|nr:DUF1553 domain-containing protein [Verrucomicrobiales bacterium]
MRFNGNDQVNQASEPASRRVGGVPKSSCQRASSPLWSLFGGALLVASGVVPANAGEPVDFNFQVRPLLSDRCYACHGPDSRARKAKLRLDTREGLFQVFGDGTAVVKPGDPAHSELVRRILTDDPDDLMPPVNSHRRLDAAEKVLLKRWVESGAGYQQHWAFVPVKPVPVPSVEGGCSNPIDAFVRARLSEHDLQPAPDAARSRLLRRLALDLTGLPPTPEEQEAFLVDDSPDAYEHVVDRYLASPAYGERMAMDWLDLARYADTYGYQNDVTRDVSSWRDWVIRAFNENLPYDRFLMWQIAGDLLPQASTDQRLATAFNRLHRQTNEGGSIEEEFRTAYVDDRVDTFGTAMLGMTVGCAKCHDHKYDPITQRDYYSLFAFFNNIDESGLYSHFTHATPTPTLLLWPDDKRAEHDRLKRQIAAAESDLDRIARAGEPSFEAWRLAPPDTRVPEPIAWFPFDAVIDDTTGDAVTTNRVAKLVDGPERVAGRFGGALEFSGDNSVVCDSVREFRRTDAFSFDLWLQPGVIQDRAVVLHQSRAWTDSGSRGFELRLDGGRPSFSLIHFWPGNALGVEATNRLPLKEWSRLTITYDGSSRAAGVRLFVNGVRQETRILRDNLRKDIVHRSAWGDSDVGNIHLTLAGRFRDEGFKQGCIDELKVFDHELTAAEVAVLGGGQPSSEPTWREHYFARVDPEWQAARARLTTLRTREAAMTDDIPEIMVMEEMAEPRPAFVLKRGAYDAPGDPVSPNTPEALLPFPPSEPRNRLGLARWLVNPQNPLTARVAVNRIWSMHFGRGIVATPEDFGSQGRLPTHPKLLDWLAGWFMEHDWDVKALHRLIVTSATYRQDSDVPAAGAEGDPENQWLARGPRHQLLAEVVRDSALAGSGLLCRKIGGGSVKPVQPEGLWRDAGVPGSYTPDTGENLHRRSLYTFWRRTAPPPNMLTFDATSREVCTARREVTVTPLQALVVLNDPQFVEAARVLAARLVREKPDQPLARIPEVWRALLARLPDDRETVLSRRIYEEQLRLFEEHPEGAREFLGIGAAPPDADLSAVDVAATTMLVSAVMNLDEFVVSR